MPSFRPPAAQARQAVQALLALGQPRHAHRASGRIHSVGTARNYEQALKGVATWQAQHRTGSLTTLTPAQALAYLQARAAVVRQKTLDLDRQALQAHLSHRPGTPVPLPVVRAVAPTRLAPRAYTPAQVARIVAQQTPPPHTRLTTASGRARPHPPAWGETGPLEALSASRSVFPRQAGRGPPHGVCALRGPCWTSSGVPRPGHGLLRKGAQGRPRGPSGPCPLLVLTRHLRGGSSHPL
jgi:hypothetical protein